MKAPEQIIPGVFRGVARNAGSNVLPWGIKTIGGRTGSIRS